MTFDVEQALSGLLAWDFSITHSGKTVAVRPLALADLAALVSIGKSASPSQALINLLAENGPEIEAWVNRFAVEHVLAALHAISVYARESIRKNSPAIASAVEAAMASPIRSSPSGDSTPA